MAKAAVICKEIQNGASKGAPDIGTGYRGFVHVGNLPGAYAVYIITGSGAQLTGIDGHANTVGGALVTGDGVRWSQLDEPLEAGLRTKLNAWLTAREMPTVGPNFTLLQLVRRAAAHFDYGTHDVFDQ